ncbi:MAG: hypothetical protein AAF480_16000 [Actinomycetota bacterium]
MEMPPIIDDFVASCRSVVAEGDSTRSRLADLVADLVGDHRSLAAVVPAFTEIPTSPRGWQLGGEFVCHRDDDLTVMVLDTLPGIAQPPHDHAMTAIIGVFQGCEDQRFWGRTPDGIEPAAGRALAAGEAVTLGERAIHAISAAHEPARAVHVYLGDIYAADRSIFDPDTLVEHPMSDDRYDAFCRSL